MIERHRPEMERIRIETENAHHELEKRLAIAAAAAREESMKKEKRIRWYVDLARGARRKFPRRGLEGGEPVPADPPPKPTPLTDGAEAPIE